MTSVCLVTAEEIELLHRLRQPHDPPMLSPTPEGASVRSTRRDGLLFKMRLRAGLNPPGLAPLDAARRRGRAQP